MGGGQKYNASPARDKYPTDRGFPLQTMNQPNKMNTVEYRQQNKSARQLQDEIRLVRLAYRDDNYPRQSRDLRLVAWVSTGVAIGGIIAICMLLSA